MLFTCLVPSLALSPSPRPTTIVRALSHKEKYQLVVNVAGMRRLVSFYLRNAGG